MTPDQINTAQDAADFCEWLIVQFEHGFIGPAEAQKLLADYTARLQTIYETRLLKFVEWSAVKGYVFKPDGKWSSGGINPGVALKYTTRELYELFLTNERKNLTSDLQREKQ